MNLEEVQRFQEENRKAGRKSKAQLEREAQEKAAASEWVRTRQMFKDLLNTPERVELYKKCKEYLILNILSKAIGRTEYNTADWAKGYMDGIETFLAIVEAYDSKREKFKI